MTVRRRLRFRPLRNRVNRTCLLATGMPKKAYETWEAALLAAGNSGVRPYACDKHGHHLGHSK
jgi:hypothetical protein